MLLKNQNQPNFVKTKSLLAGFYWIVGVVKIRFSKQIQQAKMKLHFPVTMTAETNFLNPIQAGGHILPPYMFLPCCAKTVCSGLMKLSDFKFNYIGHHLK